jgi:hypothetical protein
MSGAVLYSSDVATKRMEMLKELDPLGDPGRMLRRRGD